MKHHATTGDSSGMFDVRRFIADNFGTSTNVAVRLASFGFEAPKPAAVEKWLQRSRIPGEYFPPVLFVLEVERGRPVSVGPYMAEKGRER